MNNTARQSKIRKKAIRWFNRFFSRISIALCSNMTNFIGRKRADYVFDFDIIRSSSLELVAHEIYENNTAGDVAELGVYRGDFAEKINKAFPDRKLYLFDTFEDFDEKDIEKEDQEGYSKERHDFSKTNEKIVLKRMKFPENCIIKKGYFPETAKDIDNNFVFVSIDADLYEPIYQGLQFFYPRLVKGGYIFVHDYNESRYPGAKAAVKKFCKETDISFFPLSDI
ncbi:MAG: TylF/MycF family methyltransferase, partial [Prevotellaceae bacterium]|nr:TylF/MycF family methyltransferase [Prevotellaceae bacterium]